MPEVEERIYQLGLDALTEQERRVGDLRSRGSTLLAAGAVIASLLAKPVFHGSHPSGAGEVLLAIVGLTGAGGLLVFVILLLRPSDLGFSVKGPATYRELWERNILEQPMVDLALADTLEQRRWENERTAGQLALYLGLALVALIIETAGLAAAAALAS